MKNEKTETIEKTEANIPAEETKPAGGKGKKVVKIILNTIINILIVAVLVVSIVIATLALTSKADPNGLPNIFGYTMQYVQTPSMDKPSPDGYEGGPYTDKDVIIGKVYKPGESPELQVGDIITYNSNKKDEEGNYRLITHRIVDKQKASDGSYVYQTWGDNREVAQVPDQEKVEEYLHDTAVIAINYTSDYHGAVLAGWGDFMRTLRSQGGFFGIILIPMIIFFLYAIIRVVISAMNYKKGKADEAKEVTEAEKQKAIDEAVAAALAQKDAAAQTKPADVTAEQLEQFKQFMAFQEAQKAAESPADAPAEEPAEELEQSPEEE